MDFFYLQKIVAPKVTFGILFSAEKWAHWGCYNLYFEALRFHPVVGDISLHLLFKLKSLILLPVDSLESQTPHVAGVREGVQNIYSTPSPEIS